MCLHFIPQPSTNYNYSKMNTSTDNTRSQFDILAEKIDETVLHCASGGVLGKSHSTASGTFASTSISVLYESTVSVTPEKGDMVVLAPTSITDPKYAYAVCFIPSSSGPENNYCGSVDPLIYPGALELSLDRTGIGFWPAEISATQETGYTRSYALEESFNRGAPLTSRMELYSTFLSAGITNLTGDITLASLTSTPTNRQLTVAGLNGLSNSSRTTFISQPVTTMMDAIQVGSGDPVYFAGPQVYATDTATAVFEKSSTFDAAYMTAYTTYADAYNAGTPATSPVFLLASFLDLPPSYGAKVDVSLDVNVAVNNFADPGGFLAETKAIQCYLRTTYAYVDNTGQFVTFFKNSNPFDLILNPTTSTGLPSLNGYTTTCSVDASDTAPEAQFEFPTFFAGIELIITSSSNLAMPSLAVISYDLSVKFYAFNNNVQSNIVVALLRNYEGPYVIRRQVSWRVGPNDRNVPLLASSLELPLPSAALGAVNDFLSTNFCRSNCLVATRAGFERVLNVLGRSNFARIFNHHGFNAVASGLDRLVEEDPDEVDRLVVGASSRKKQARGAKKFGRGFGKFMVQNVAKPSVEMGLDFGEDALRAYSGVPDLPSNQYGAAGVYGATGVYGASSGMTARESRQTFRQAARKFGASSTPTLNGANGEHTGSDDVDRLPLESDFEGITTRDLLNMHGNRMRDGRGDTPEAQMIKRVLLNRSEKRVKIYPTKNSILMDPAGRALKSRERAHVPLYNDKSVIMPTFRGKISDPENTRREIVSGQINRGIVRLSRICEAAHVSLFHPGDTFSDQVHILKFMMIVEKTYNIYPGDKRKGFEERAKRALRGVEHLRTLPDFVDRVANDRVAAWLRGVVEGPMSDSDAAMALLGLHSSHLGASSVQATPVRPTAQAVPAKQEEPPEPVELFTARLEGEGIEFIFTSRDEAQNMLGNMASRASKVSVKLGKLGASGVVKKNRAGSIDYDNGARLITPCPMMPSCLPHLTRRQLGILERVNRGKDVHDNEGDDARAIMNLASSYGSMFHNSSLGASSADPDDYQLDSDEDGPFDDDEEHSGWGGDPEAHSLEGLVPYENQTPQYTDSADWDTSVVESQIADFQREAVALSAVHHEPPRNMDYLSAYLGNHQLVADIAHFAQIDPLYTTLNNPTFFVRMSNSVPNIIPPHRPSPARFLAVDQVDPTKVLTITLLLRTSPMATSVYSTHSVNINGIFKSVNVSHVFAQSDSDLLHAKIQDIATMTDLPISDYWIDIARDWSLEAASIVGHSWMLAFAAAAIGCPRGPIYTGDLAVSSDAEPAIFTVPGDIGPKVVACMRDSTARLLMMPFDVDIFEELSHLEEVQSVAEVTNTLAQYRCKPGYSKICAIANIADVVSYNMITAPKFFSDQTSMDSAFAAARGLAFIDAANVLSGLSNLSGNDGPRKLIDACAQADQLGQDPVKTVLEPAYHKLSGRDDPQSQQSLAAVMSLAKLAGYTFSKKSKSAAPVKPPKVVSKAEKSGVDYKAELNRYLADKKIEDDWRRKSTSAGKVVLDKFTGKILERPKNEVGSNDGVTREENYAARAANQGIEHYQVGPDRVYTIVKLLFHDRPGSSGGGSSKKGKKAGGLKFNW